MPYKYAAECVCECDNQLYVYCTHEGSLLRSNDTAKYINGLNGFDRLENKMLNSKTEAARVFLEMGKARFLLGIVRRAALQLERKDFLKLTESVNFGKYRCQVGNLPLKQRIAGYMFLTSKWLFYYVSKILFSD